MKKVDVFLSNNITVWLDYSLDDFTKEHLDDNGNFKKATIGTINEEGVKTLIFTNQIVAIREKTE